MKRALCAVLLLGCTVTSGVVLAVDDETKDWLVSIGQEQVPAERTVGGVRETGVWVTRQGHCSRISVMIGKAASPDRIDHYRVCGTRIVIVDEVPPALSGSALFQAAEKNAVMMALMSGEYSTRAEGFDIRVRRSGEPDAKGCAPIEVTISHSLLLVANRMGTRCP